MGGVGSTSNDHKPATSPDPKRKTERKDRESEKREGKIKSWENANPRKKETVLG
jgi:hypothetical protein